MLSSALPRLSPRHPNRTGHTGLGARRLLAVLAVSGTAACGADQRSSEGVAALRAVPQVASAPLSESFASAAAGGRFLLFREGLVVDLQTRKIVHRFPGTRLLRRNQQPHKITIAEFPTGGGIVDLVSGRFLCCAPLGARLEDAAIGGDGRTCLLLTRSRYPSDSPPTFTASVIDLETGTLRGTFVVPGPPGLRGFRLRIEGEVGEELAWSIHARSGHSDPSEPYKFRVYLPKTRHEIRLSPNDGRPISDWREIEPDNGLKMFEEGWTWNRGFHERDGAAPEPTPGFETLSAVEVIPGVKDAWATEDLRVLVTLGEGFALWSVEEASRDATTAIPAELSAGSPSVLLDPRRVVLAMATKPSLGEARRFQAMTWDTQDGSWTERPPDSALGENLFLGAHGPSAKPCRLDFYDRDGVAELVLTDPDDPRIGRPRGRSIARFVEFGDGEWIVLGEDGIYNGSAGATKHVAWFRPDGSLASEAEVSTMRRPDELRKRIRDALDCEGEGSSPGSSKPQVDS